MKNKKEKIIAYKVFNSDWTCKGFKYEIGKTYTHKENLDICSSGFHACEKITDCFNYYSFDNNNKVAIVEILGNIQRKEDDTKIATDKIRIVKELTWEKVLKLANDGKNNVGHSNTGCWNTGNWNIGDSNTGHSNTGHRNTGHRNTGDSNTGHRNTGHSNTGHRNTGHRNTGNWNTGDSNTGNFNTNTPDKIRIFNKWISAEKGKKIYYPDFLCFNTTIWISHDTATEEEKIKYKASIENAGGFTKTIDYKEAFKKSWNNANKEDRIKIKKIPGFSAKLFFEISSIDVDKDND